MTQWHERSSRKKTGGKRNSNRRSDRILAWKGGDAAETIVAGENRRRTVEKRGSTSKVRQLRANTASITVPGQKKAVKAEILAVAENQANRLYTRRNIITKGASIKVKIEGKEETAKVTSRPGQSGVVQAVLQKK